MFRLDQTKEQRATFERKEHPLLAEAEDEFNRLHGTVRSPRPGMPA